jgi:hypothetical protein
MEDDDGDSDDPSIQSVGGDAAGEDAQIGGFLFQRQGQGVRGGLAPSNPGQRVQGTLYEQANPILQREYDAEQQRILQHAAWLEQQQTELARQQETNVPFQPGAPYLSTGASQHRDPVAPPKQPDPRSYQSPERPNRGHAAKGKYDLTPNSSRLNSSLQELSLEKQRRPAKGQSPAASQRTAPATKAKLQARPAQQVPPEQTVKGTLPHHQRRLDEA